MLLQKLLSSIPTGWKARIEKSRDIDVTSLAYDSRRVVGGSLFFAIEGMVTDGHLFLDEAVSRGAIAVASERSNDSDHPIAWIEVDSIREFMARCSNHFHGNPSQDLNLIGVTGTNGKTTTCYLAHSIMEGVGPSLRIGTIDAVIGEQRLRTELTTPESTDIQEVLRSGVEQQCRHGIVEVSSHALLLKRVFECEFPVAVFTNLSQDHLDFHKTLDEYFLAKKLLFQSDYNPGIKHIVTNSDDPFGLELASTPGPQVSTYGLGEEADIYPIHHREQPKGQELVLDFFGRRLELHSPLFGKHNLYNIMAAAAACSVLGISDDKIRRGINQLPNVPGRFERLELDVPFTIILDFAHTPDALQNVLRLAAAVSDGRVICVFGCGGDRDRAKRPLMGGIATESADFVIVTSDNPRSEDPSAIVREVCEGIPLGNTNFESIPDRREAIYRALELADEGDLVLLAGKGHERHQEIAGRKHHFDEREVVREALCLN